MDVRLMPLPTQYPHISQGLPGGENEATPEKQFSELSNSKEKPEKVMMDLKDVQNFLYLLVGSKIRIEPDTDTVGSNVNTAV